MMNKPQTMPPGAKPTRDDTRNLAELKKLKTKITKDIESYKFHLAAENIYHYIWHTFADKVVESYKPRLSSSDERDRAAAYQTLETILLESLALLHPFMPFITEAIYSRFKSGELLMVRKW